MDTEQMIRLLRRKIAEVDPATSEYTDPELLRRLGDALIALQARMVKGFDGVMMDPHATSETYGITPTPASAQGLILVYRAATDLLNEEFQGRLRRGEIGVSWKSGLEEESTATAAQHYANAIGEIEQELQALILIQQAKFTAFRNQ